MTLRVQVTLPHDSGMGTDVTVNQFHCLGVDGGGTDLEDLAAAFLPFYEELEEYYSTVLTGDAEIKIYDLADAEPREPRYEGTQTGAFTPTTPTLPEECAVAVTWTAALSVGVPIARRRGRNYIGPCSSAVSEYDSVTGHTIPAGVRSDIMNSGINLVQATAAAGHRLAVYSRVDEVARGVTRVSVDDALDTIRSRGHRPSVRTTSGDLV